MSARFDARYAPWPRRRAAHRLTGRQRKTIIPGEVHLERRRDPLRYDKGAAETRVDDELGTTRRAQVQYAIADPATDDRCVRPDTPCDPHRATRRGPP